MLFPRCRRKLTENVVVPFLLPKACVLAHPGPWSQERPKKGTTEDMGTWTPLCLSSQGGLWTAPPHGSLPAPFVGKELPHHRWKSPFLSRQLDLGPALSVTSGTFYDISFSIVQSRLPVTVVLRLQWDGILVLLGTGQGSNHNNTFLS